MSSPHHIYLIPGLFGFRRIAGIEYFAHVQRALHERFDAAGVPCRIVVVPTPPTASIRRRAAVVANEVAESLPDDGGPVHLVAHSTGGLDARLLASPSSAFPRTLPEMTWRERLDSVVTMSTPHYGTPLAQFFATVSGTRLLYALSLLTVTTLGFGGPPLSALSAILAAARHLDVARTTFDIRLLDRATEHILRFIGEDGRAEVQNWLQGIYRDQGAIIQISPEAMDLFNVTTENAQDVRYGSLVARAPAPGFFRLASKVRSPYAALSAGIYTTLYTVASRPHPHYPYPSPASDDETALERTFAEPPGAHMSDGVVPTMSMLWGELLWSGVCDHLDVLGHFGDDARPARHTDWLSCGSDFGRAEFTAAMDAIGAYLLRGG